MWIKICGIRDVATASRVASFAPNAIGLNFFEKSPRYVRPDVAAEIVRILPTQTTPVGVFVNATVAEIVATARACSLSTIQLHGDEPPELLAELRGYRIIRAFRLGNDGLGPLADYLERCESLDALPVACLVDSKVDGVYGGSGQTAPWDVLQRDYLHHDWPSLILAGGLRPDNVTTAIRAVAPWGVDVAGGVESSPGVKDAALVQSFIANALVN